MNQLAGVEEEARFELAREFNVSPNPARGRATARFLLARETVAGLRVLDAGGRVVAVLAEGRLPAGRHTFTWNAAAVPAGVYYYRLTAGGRSETRPVVVTR